MKSPHGRRRRDESLGNLILPAFHRRFFHAFFTGGFFPLPGTGGFFPSPDTGGFFTANSWLARICPANSCLFHTRFFHAFLTRGFFFLNRLAQEVFPGGEFCGVFFFVFHRRFFPLLTEGFFARFSQEVFRRRFFEKRTCE